jgi:hypothetical protein
MFYHNGPVLTGFHDVYFIFYGCWTDNCGSAGDTATMTVLTNFMSSIGSTPYMAIDSTYPDSNSQAPNGALLYGGSVIDSSYSHGTELTETDIEQILDGHIGSSSSQTDLPTDPLGIYIIVASADVNSTATGFCTADAPPFHDYYLIYGSTRMPYIFLGNPNRCPAVAGPQFIGRRGKRLPTPNNSFAGDAMVTNLAHALNGTLTNPFGNGWFDRYGLENADKCSGTFGRTFTTANGAQANIHLSGNYDYLIEQNWINDRRGRCVMSP